jgi:hypothetical protein
MRIMNERYARRFEFGNTPARATIQMSSLPRAHTSPTQVSLFAMSSYAMRLAPKTWPQSYR